MILGSVNKQDSFLLGHSVLAKAGVETIFQDEENAAKISVFIFKVKSIMN